MAFNDNAKEKTSSQGTLNERTKSDKTPFSSFSSLIFCD